MKSTARHLSVLYWGSPATLHKHCQSVSIGSAAPCFIVGLQLQHDSLKQCHLLISRFLFRWPRRTQFPWPKKPMDNWTPKFGRWSNSFPASVGFMIHPWAHNQPGRGDKHLNHRNVSNKSALKDAKNVLRQVPRKISCKKQSVFESWRQHLQIKGWENDGTNDACWICRVRSCVNVLCLWLMHL